MKEKQRIANLELELGRYRKKVAGQLREIRELRADRDRNDAAMRQINLICDALLVSVALAYGKKKKDGTRRLELPTIRPVELMEAWDVSTKGDRERDVYVVVVKPHAKPAKQAKATSELVTPEQKQAAEDMFFAGVAEGLKNGQ